MRVGDKPLRRQTRTMQIAPRKPNTRNVKLANNTRRHRLKTTVQNVNSIIGKRTPNRDLQATFVPCTNNMANRIDRSFGRTIKVGDPIDLEVTRDLAMKFCR